MSNAERQTLNPKSLMPFTNALTKMLNIKHPLVMAPMFLVSNVAMIKEAINEGILGCFPSLNFRNEGELEKVLEELNSYLSTRKNLPGNYGVNIIVQRANPWTDKHIAICVKYKVPVIITSLGNPAETIRQVHAYGGKVFCDVTNIEHATKCNNAGCDGFVAVGQGAGGHAGPFPLILLIETLKNHFPDKPILAAGGIANGRALFSVLAAGASAGYCGTRFIASTEATVSQEYKQSILDSGMKDIILTERISGTPCTIINTEFAKKIGTKQNQFEKFMSNNPKTKKYFKMLIQRRGFNWLEDAVKPGNYNNLWCAGQTVEVINDIKPMKEIIAEMVHDMDAAYSELKNNFEKK
jgi:nitronate monooxygenase